MKLPDTPASKSPLPAAAWYRQAVDMLRDLRARVAALEASARVRRVVQSRANAVPWKLSGFTETDPAAAKIRVAPGMVGNFVPTIGGVSLVAVPPPALTVTGSSGIIYLKATVDAAGSITALVVENASSIPTDTETEKHKLVGTWTSASGAFTSVVSILDANQTLYLCNGTAIWEA